MPIGKDIHNYFSKNHGKRQKRMGKIIKNQIPAHVDQWKKNVVTRAMSNNTHITELTGPKPNVAQQRKVSPNEGKPTVNAQSGPSVEKKLIHKPKLKNERPDSTAGAIKKIVTKKVVGSKTKKPEPKCGFCKQTGHNKRTCPERP